MGLAAAIGVLVFVAASLQERDAGAPGAQSLAGLTAAPSSETARDADVPAAGSETTFDDLPIDASLPEPWIVAGGGGASVIPLPTSVDRSVRLFSGDDGSPATACLTFPPESVGPSQVSVDVLVATHPASLVPLLTVEAFSQTLAEVGLEADGSLVEADAALGATVETFGTPPPDASDRHAWRRVEVTTPFPADTLCLSSPQGTAGGWIAFDGLVLEP